MPIGKGRGSGNRKYTQLTGVHLGQLFSMFNKGVNEKIHECGGSHANQHIDEAIFTALSEAIDRANQLGDNARICLAHAVRRKEY
jgi:hypothetical protein